MKDCKKLIYRYLPPDEVGLKYRFWNDTHGPHLDPLQWSGPADHNGFPLPTANPPDYEGVSNVGSVSDAAITDPNEALRYSIIEGWVNLPPGTTHIRDANGNTGELGMILTAKCCGGILTEQAGGNHTVNTSGADRSVMDVVPATEGWLYIYSPQSDSSAFHGIQLQYSTDGGTTFANVPEKQPDTPVVQCIEVTSCTELTEGWQLKRPRECCEASYITDGGGLSEEEVLALLPEPIVVPEQEICTGDFVDVTGRAGWLPTWTPIYTANSGTIIEDWLQISTAEVSPNCATDITVNVSLGNSYMLLRNMYGRSWFDVRLLINGTAVTTFTFQNYHYDRSSTPTDSVIQNKMRPLGSTHFARASVPAGASITVELRRRHNFVIGPAAGATPYGRLISGLRAHFNVHYSPINIVTGRI